MASNEHEVHVWDLTEALEEKVNDVVIGASSTGDVKDVQPICDVNGDEIGLSAPQPLIPNSDGLKVEAGSSTRVFSKPTSVLKAHHQRVISLTWSPHEDGKLVSVSYDNTAQVRKDVVKITEDTFNISLFYVGL